MSFFADALEAACFGALNRGSALRAAGKQHLVRLTAPLVPVGENL